MKKTTTETKPEMPTTEKAQLFTAWANLQVAKIHLTEAHSRNRALGNGIHYDKEIIQVNDYLAWVEERLAE